MVVCCKVFPKSPHCISADEHCNIKIWDLRNMMAIQSIRSERAMTFQITTIEILPKIDRFVLGGKSIQVFRNETTKSQIEAREDEYSPLQVNFNPYFTTMSVLTP